MSNLSNVGYTTEWSRYLMQKKVEYASPYLRGSVLNYGCGEPDLFFDCIKKYDIQYHPYDLNIKGLDSFPMLNYDVVFCSLVIEHVANPKEEIETIFSLLKKNGHFICIVPNRFSFQRVVKKQFKKLTKWDKNAGHIHLFDWCSFLQLFDEHHIVDILGVGFKPVNSDQMLLVKEYWNDYCDVVLNNEDFKFYASELMVIVK